MKTACTILLMLLCAMTRAQWQGTEPDKTTEQNLEDLSESAETEPEDDYDVQQLAEYKQHPLNINGTQAELNECPLLQPLQVQSLVRYRQLLGDFISVYELQAVPEFTTDQIRSLLPYITVAARFQAETFKQRLQAGRQVLMFRPSLTPETAKGFSRHTAPAQRFSGGREKIMVRYQYRCSDLLQYGILGDQDAGEPFTVSHHQAGFDFYSFHLFARKMGVIQSLALGDYTVNLGQGLIQWQSQAFKKSAGVINIKRQSETLRPYRSAGEYNFFRGAAITLRKGHVESSLFGSRRQLSANIATDDQHQQVITSIQTSGLHRTLSEIADRNTAAQTVAGGNLKWLHAKGQLGLNAVAYQYSLPLLKRNDPYNLFAVKGRHWANYSVDYSLILRNYHLFGEFAADLHRHPAIVQGLMGSLGSMLDIAVLYRFIGPGYQSLYGNAFTENTFPSNEHGLYAGMSVRPASSWSIDLYADFFRFPWLRYRADAPGSGTQYFAGITWKPNKMVEMYSRFRLKRKPVNETPAGTVGFPVDRQLRNWRTHVSFQLHRDWLLRNRIEMCWFGEPRQPDPKVGFLLFSDVLYKPFGKRWSASARFLAFETEGYDTRLYAYENDVPLSNSTPAFFGRGTRLYGNLKIKMSPTQKKYELDLGVKMSVSLYSGSDTIGSGPETIPGHHRSDLKVQLLLTPT